jgi:TatD DNase family protein
VPAPPPKLPGLIDTHCHLDYPPMIDDVAATLTRAAAAGVERCVHIGCTPAAWSPALALAHAHADVFCALGVHPHEATLADEPTLAALADHVRDPRVVGVGETGLDYFYDRSPRAVQQAAMAAHLAIARAAGKPVILHIRDAHADAWAVVDAAPAVPGVVHCFTGTPTRPASGPAAATPCRSRGSPRSRPRRPCVRPRGSARPTRSCWRPTRRTWRPCRSAAGPNEPANVAFTCARLAAVRGVAAEELARTAAANAVALFGLPARG